MLELKHVYAGYAGQDVVHDICCCFEQGQNYCLVGPNGGGKTTLLRAAAALIAHRGEITLEGRPLQSFRRRELASRMAILSQSSSNYFPYSVYDTVMLGRYHYQKRSFGSAAAAADREAVERCLRRIGLWDMRERQLDTLSGGQRQRVFLAQVLAQEPQLILLDEPANHLDLKHQLELICYLREWTAEGEHSVIGVFHDLNLALQLSENMLFMSEGRLLRCGNFYQVADRAFLQRLFGVDVAEHFLRSLQLWQRLQ